MSINERITLDSSGYSSGVQSVLEDTNSMILAVQKARDNIRTLADQKFRTQMEFEDREAQRQISEFQKSLSGIKKDIAVIISAKDLASESISKIKSNVSELAHKTYSFEINAIDKTKSVLGGIKDSIFNLKTLAGSIVLGMGGKGAFDLTLGNAMTNEMSLATLQTVLHDKQAGSDALKWSYKEASNTPFDAKEVVSGVSQLATSHLDFKKYLEPLGDAASAFNKPLEQAIFAMGKLKSGQLGMGVDMLRDFGVSNQDWTAKGVKFSKNGEMQGMNGDQASEMALSILKSKYGGLMDEHSGTAKGMISNIGDTINGMGRGLAGIDDNGQTMKNGLFDNFKKQLQIIMPLLNKVQGSKAFSSLQKDIGNLATAGGQKITAFLKGLQDPSTLDKYKASFKSFIDGVKAGGSIALSTAKAFVAVGSALKPVIDLVANHPKLFVGLFAGFEVGKGLLSISSFVGGSKKNFSDLKVALGAMKLGFIDTFSSIGGLIAKYPIVAGIGAIVIALSIITIAVKENWSKISPILNEAGNAIKTFFQPAINLFQSIGNTISNFAGSQISQISNWMNSNATLISSTVKIIDASLHKITDPIRQEGSNIYTSIQDTITKITPYINSGLNNIKTVITNILTSLNASWKMHCTSVYDIIKNIWDIIKTIVSTTVKVIEDILKLGMQVINGNWKGAWSTIKDLTQTIFGGIVKIVSDVGKSILDVFGKPYDTLKKNLTDLSDKIIKGVDGKIKDLTSTLEKHQTAIKATATILTVLFGPALVKVGLEATIAGAKITGVFIISMVKAGASAIVNGAKITASFIVSMVKAGAGAVVAGAKITASFVMALIKAGASAIVASAQIMMSVVVTLARVATGAILAGAALTGKFLLALAKVSVAGWKFMASNPIILAISLIVLAVAGLYLAWKNDWGGIRETTKKVIDDIKQWWNDLVEFFKHPITGIINIVKNAPKDVTLSDKTGGVTGNTTNAEYKKMLTGKGKALGTNYYEGGLTWVGEHGPELLNPRKGSQIFSNRQSLNMMNTQTKVQTPNFTDMSKSIKSQMPNTQSWGSDIPSGMAKGIKGNIKPVTDAVTTMATKIKELIHFTSPDKGPLVDFDTYPVDMMKTFGDGIKTNTKLVTKPTTDMSTGVQNIYGDLTTKSGQSAIQAMQEFGKGIQDSVGNITAIVKTLTDKVIDTFKTGFGIHSPSVVMYKMGGHLMQGLMNGMTSKDMAGFVQQWIGSMTGTAGGAISGNLVGWLTTAIALTGAPMSWLPALEQIAMGESGGDPRNINTYDINAQEGHPSMGLMQLIQENMDDWHLPGMTDIMNPIANAAASIRLIQHQYGSPYNTPGIRSEMAGGPYKGYAVGLSRVPYDNFPAFLHEGEKILTRPEADNQSGTNKGNIIIQKLADNLTVRNKADIDAIISGIYKKFKETAYNM